MLSILAAEPLPGWVPPREEVFSAVREVVIPAGMAGVVVAGVLAVLSGWSWLGRWRLRYLKGATGGLAMVAGLAAGNWVRGDVLPWMPGPEPYLWNWLGWTALAAALVEWSAASYDGDELPGGSLPALPAEPNPATQTAPAPQTDEPIDTATYQDLWRSWPPRLGLAVMIAALMVPAEFRLEPWWVWPATVAAVVVPGGVLATLAGRLAVAMPLVLAMAFHAAAVVLLHAGSARFTDLAVMAGSAAGGLAAMAAMGWLSGGAVASAGLVGTSLLTGLMLSAEHETFSEVPPQAFAAVAICPVGAVVGLLVPRRWCQQRPVAVTAAVLAVSGGLALLGLVWTVQAETLNFDH